ncbi:MAG: PQQ-binding-like beta-propeller repeat protein [Bacteroidota bacterium]|nr:PQQ-binding-like beta-propeller repeat protein [Bacteroidota bacterium]
MKKITTVLIILILSFYQDAIYSQVKRPVHFAWLSDIHVGSTNAAEDLSRSVHDINSLSGVDFVIISGDISQSGKTSDLRLTKSILDSLKMPYYIIPGNHDAKWSESGATMFSKIWKSDRFVFERSGIKFIGLYEGPLMRMADGHFAPEDLRWLDKVISQQKNKLQPVIFVTHYPVDNEIDNWFEFIKRAKKLNTQVVLVGHGHANREMNFEGIPGIMGRSNLRAGKAVGGYNLVEIKDDSIFFSERIPESTTKPVWAKVALGMKSYKTDTTKYERPEFSINKKYPEIKEKWRVETNYVIASAPLVWKDVVISCDSKGEVNAFSLNNGSKKWTFKTGSGVYSSPDVYNDKVVFASTDGNIYCINPKFGKLLWKFKTGSPIVAAPKIDSGIVYIGSSEGKFRAIDLKTGKLVWTFDKLGGFVETRPIIYEGKVIFGAWDSYLYALDKNNGNLVWKWSNGKSEILFSPAACWPVATNEKVFVVAPDRYMTAINVSTGETIWRTNKYQVREAIGISEDGNTIHTRTMNDTVLAFSSKSSDPETIWVKNAKYGYDFDPSMTIEKQGTAFFGTRNGFVYAIDAKTGETNWIYRTGTGSVNTVFPLSKDKVIISNMDGSLMLLEKGNK